ncbi:MAG: SDR family NAD(P)-dependent oxidoreductase [Rectinemataceae bacterium]
MKRRRIVITGATSGIGRATARALADGNHDLIIAARNAALLEETAVGFRAADPAAEIHALVVDFASFASIRDFSSRLHENFDSIDVLFNCAGLFMDRPGRTAEGFEMTIGVNHLGSFLLTRLLVDLLAKGDGPQIVNVCSKAALFASFRDRPDAFARHPAGFRAYSASKLLQLLSTLRLSEELAGLGITVNAIHPGDAATGIWKGESLLMRLANSLMVRRLSSPEEAAKAGLFLLENEAMRKVSGGFFEREGIGIPLPARLRGRSLSDAIARRTDEAIAGRA